MISLLRSQSDKDVQALFVNLVVLVAVEALGNICLELIVSDAIVKPCDVISPPSSAGK